MTNAVAFEHAMAAAGFGITMGIVILLVLTRSYRAPGWSLWIITAAVVAVGVAFAYWAQSWQFRYNPDAGRVFGIMGACLIGAAIVIRAIDKLAVKPAYMLIFLIVLIVCGAAVAKAWIVLGLAAIAGIVAVMLARIWAPIRIAEIAAGLHRPIVADQSLLSDYHGGPAEIHRGQLLAAQQRREAPQAELSHHKRHLLTKQGAAKLPAKQNQFSRW